MLSVYVCDDIAEQCTNFCKEINQYTLMQDWDIKAAVGVTSPQALLDLISTDTNTGLYFLDVNLNTDMDGFDLAKRIRRKDHRGFIVFLTTQGEKAPLAFKYRVEAMDYIIKTDTDVIQRIRECLQEAYGHYQGFSENSDNRICFKQKPADKYVDRKDILSISTTIIPHQLAITCVNEEFTLYGKLKDFEKELGSEFIRIHKTCIVNRQQITEVHRQTRTVTLQNGRICEASHRFMKNVGL